MAGEKLFTHATYGIEDLRTVIVPAPTLPVTPPPLQ
jgi:hypothetical protein